MAVYGVLSGNLIANAIVAESIEDAIELIGENIIELPVGPGEPGIGWLYDKETGIFTDPNIEEVTPAE